MYNKQKKKEYNKIWNEKNKEYKSQKWKEWFEKNKVRRKEYQKNYMKKYWKTHQDLQDRRKYRKEYRNINSKKIIAEKLAIKNIEIPKNKLCEVCNENLARIRHHDDYSEPLKIRFVCSECHGIIHRK